MVIQQIMRIDTRSFAGHLRTIGVNYIEEAHIRIVVMMEFEDVMSEEEAEGHFSEGRQNNPRTSMSICTDSGSDSIVYRSKNLSAKGFAALNKMRETNQLCDVAIMVDEREFRAHRAVLAATVPYFMAMFTSERVVQCSSALL